MRLSRRPNSILVGLLALVASTQGAVAISVDIRDCPLETTMFVDWLGDTTFAARRVGTAYSYLCPNGLKAPDPGCDGPYGELVVEGELSTGGNPPEIVHAVWSVYKSVPCCRWSLSRPAESDPEAWEGFSWLSPGAGPTLRDQAFYTIGSEEEPVFERQMFAVACIVN